MLLKTGLMIRVPELVDGAAVGMDGDGEPIAADNPINRAAALPARGVDVVEHLPVVHRGDLSCVVPLRAGRLVAGISGNIAGGSRQVGVGIDPKSERADGVAELRRQKIAP